MLDENIHGDVVAALAAKHSMSRRFEIRVWAADQTSRLQVSYGPKRAVSSPSISTSPIRAASPQRNTPGSLFCDWGPRPRATRSPACPDSSKNRGRQDRKSTRLNSSHLVISYAVFCLKKKKNKQYRAYTSKRKKKKKGKK